MKNILSARKIILFINLLGAFLGHKASFSGAFNSEQEPPPQKIIVIQACLNQFPSAAKEKQLIDLEIDVVGHHLILSDASYLVYRVNPHVTVSIPQAIKQEFTTWRQHKDNPAMLTNLLRDWQLYSHVGNDDSNIISVLYNAITRRLIYFSGQVVNR